MCRFNRGWHEKAGIDEDNVDIDSSLISHIGERGDVTIGYKPKRRGRGSHHAWDSFSA